MTPTVNSEEAAKPVVLGRISGLYGVKGWVKVFSYTEPREAILGYRACLLGQEGRWEPARIAEGRRHGKGVVVRIAATEDRDAAAKLVGAEIAVARAELPAPAAGEYYWADLEGLRVLRRDGSELGIVAYLMATGAHDVMVVQGDAETLIPFVPDEIVLDVDLVSGVIRVDWEWD